MRVTILKIWAGLIFVDAVTPVRPDQLSPEPRADLYEIPTYEYYIFSMMYGLGLPRVMGQCSKAYAGFEEHTERMLAESVCNSSLGAIWNEYKGWGQSFDETIRTGPYGDLPILIFSHDPQKHSGAGAPSRPELEESVMWNQMQEDLKKLSTRSRRIIFRGSGHEIPLERADLLNKEVLVFVQQIRDEAPQPTDYHAVVSHAFRFRFAHDPQQQAMLARQDFEIGLRRCERLILMKPLSKINPCAC
jgi:hypothetical protein